MPVEKHVLLCSPRMADRGEGWVKVRLMVAGAGAALGRPINSAALRCNTKHVFTRSLMGQEGRRGFLFTCHR